MPEVYPTYTTTTVCFLYKLLVFYLNYILTYLVACFVCFRLTFDPSESAVSLRAIPVGEGPVIGRDGHGEVLRGGHVRIQ